jgi:hypothetical protein
MTRKKLDKLKRELAELRRSPQRATALERLAKGLGRKLVKRGKHPMWESAEFTSLFPLAIPHHGGRDLAPGTKRSILDQLEDDVLAWEARLEDDEEDKDESAGGEDDDDGEGNGAG